MLKGSIIIAKANSKIRYFSEDKIMISKARKKVNQSGKRANETVG
jgi:hypothetical protein